MLAAHTSACSLTEPFLARDVHNALITIREKDSCDSLLQAASRDAAVAVSPSAVHQLALAAPSWLPYPAATASEYLDYFSKSSTIELAAAATLLRQQNLHQQVRRRAGEQKKEETTRIERIEPAEPHAAVRAELLAMALCLPLSQNNITFQLHQEAEIPLQGTEKLEEESSKRKLSQRLPEDPLAQELCSLLRSTPSLAVSLPAPLLSRACRSSFPLSVEYAAAVEKLRAENSVPVTSVIVALKCTCLINDTTALLFKDVLDTIYKSI